MNILLFIIFFPQNDSIAVLKQDSVQAISIMFQAKETSEVRTLRYKHTQGFFCDFEDNINKGKKINLNIGVGKQ